MDNIYIGHQMLRHEPIMLQAFADCSEKGLIDKIGITCFAIFVELIKVYEF